MAMFLIITNLLLLSIIVFLKIKNNHYLSLASNAQRLEEEHQSTLKENIAYQIKITELTTILDKERELTQNVQEMFATLQTQLIEKFKAANSDMVLKNNDRFLNLATSTFDNKEKSITSTIDSLKQMLGKFDTKVNELEKSRVGAYEEMRGQLNVLTLAYKELGEKTSALTSALRSPNVRGHWGEMQLRRLLEISGMIPHVDFVEQMDVASKDGHSLRPDVLVNIPNGRQIVIDAKTPLLEYCEALAGENETRKEKLLKDFVKKVKDHINSLSKKNYQDYIKFAPDFVIMFMPSEALFATALAQDPAIIEFAADKRITLATPSTLLSMLNIIASIWKHDAITDNINYIIQLGKDICKGIDLAHDNLNKIGKSLQTSLATYHETMAILEKQAFVNSKQFIDAINSTENNKRQEVIFPINEIEQTAVC